MSLYTEADCKNIWNKIDSISIPRDDTQIPGSPKQSKFLQKFVTSDYWTGLALWKINKELPRSQKISHSKSKLFDRLYQLGNHYVIAIYFSFLLLSGFLLLVKHAFNLSDNQALVSLAVSLAFLVVLYFSYIRSIFKKIDMRIESIVQWHRHLMSCQDSCKGFVLAKYSFQELHEGILNIHTEYKLKEKKLLDDMQRDFFIGYIKNCKISEGRIDGVGSVTIDSLESRGVLTAYDLFVNETLNIPGIGEGKFKALRQWAKTVAPPYDTACPEAVAAVEALHGNIDTDRDARIRKLAAGYDELTEIAKKSNQNYADFLVRLEGAYI